MACASWNKSLAILSYLLFIASVIAKQQSVKVIDADDNEIESIAQDVCNLPRESQISKISTIVKLADYLDTLPKEHKLAHCRESYNDTFKKLKKLVSSYNNDVCGRQKIDMIVKMHQFFILRPEDLRIRSDKSIPKVSQLFYIHYVYHLSIVCKKSLIERLDSTEARENELKLADKTAEIEELDRRIKDVLSKAGSSGSLKSFHDIALFWSMLDRSWVGPSGGPFSVPTKSNNYKRVSFISADSYKILRLQRECEKLKSVYESPLLAVIRLIDIGYYVKGEMFGDELAKRPSLRRLIGFVLICETWMPVRAIQDDSVAETKRVSNKEADRYTPGFVDLKDDRDQPAKFEIATKDRNHQIEVDSLSFATSDLAGSLAERLMVNIRSRGHVLNRFMKSYLSVMKNSVKGIFTQLASQTKNDLYPSDLLPLFNMLA